MRRVLVLRIRRDGRVRLLRVAMRGDRLTYRRGAGLLGDDNAAAVYAALFRRAKFDAVCPRIFSDGKWINPLRTADAA